MRFLLSKPDWEAGLEGQASLIMRAFAFCGDAIEAGAAVSLDKQPIRVRNLPLR